MCTVISIYFPRSICHFVAKLFHAAVKDCSFKTKLKDPRQIFDFLTYLTYFNTFTAFEKNRRADLVSVNAYERETSEKNPFNKEIMT